jgi:hypothetical protein
VALVPLATFALGLAFASISLAQNAITDWHAVMETTVAATGRKNVVALPYFAYVDVAMYDAVNSIDGRFQPFAVSVHAPPGASKDAAAATAAHDVLVNLFPAQKYPAQAPTFETALATSLAAIADGQSKTDGINVGKAVAAQWLALRAGDGLEAAITFTPGHGPGIWEPVPTYPASPPTIPAPVGVWMRQFKPFAMTSADQFLADVAPPLTLTSAAWARDFNLTKDYGALNSTVRTSAQTEIGLFWTDNAAAQDSRSFRALVASQSLDTAAAARLGAMYTVAASDAGTACMNAKYHFAFWRPYTAIHDADTDNNPSTVADPNWIPLAPTPGHPEYPSNHACVTEAVMEVFSEFFDSDGIPYKITSTVTGTTHSFTSFEDVVTEVGNARIFGGMHFRHAVKEGNRLGRKVAEYVLKTHFQPKDE